MAPVTIIWSIDTSASPLPSASAQAAAALAGGRQRRGVRAATLPGSDTRAVPVGVLSAGYELRSQGRLSGELALRASTLREDGVTMITLGLLLGFHIR